MDEANRIRVAFLASEADPLVKVGGLGDVAGSLPRELNRMTGDKVSGSRLDVRLFLPFHWQIRKKITPEKIDQFFLSSTIEQIPVEVFLYPLEQTPVYLFSFPMLEEQTPVYSGDNQRDGEIYTCFSAAVMRFLVRSGWKPDIIHANDWHTAPAISLLRQKRSRTRFFSKTRSILTVHNLPYMGGGAEESLRHFRIPQARDGLLPKWARKQPLPIGLEATERIVAVSPTYAKEILTPEFGCGLERFLISRQARLTGIVNGLDYQAWDPSNDKTLAAQFSIDLLQAREKNKQFLVKQFDFAAASAPLLVYISRMDFQKGIDILLEGLSASADLPWNAIILGTGDPKLEEKCREFELDYSSRVRVVIGFDPRLARQLYAGGDMLLMPSRYEPCGLAQMIAMRYGCIPMARATGGLRDTIAAYPDKNATGFLFEEASGASFSRALKTALKVFQNQSEWSEMQVRGMKMDFSWKKSAEEYAKTYLAVLRE